MGAGVGGGIPVIVKGSRKESSGKDCWCWEKQRRRRSQNTSQVKPPLQGKGGRPRPGPERSVTERSASQEGPSSGGRNTAPARQRPVEEPPPLKQPVAAAGWRERNAEASAPPPGRLAGVQSGARWGGGRLGGWRRTPSSARSSGLALFLSLLAETRSDGPAVPLGPSTGTGAAISIFPGQRQENGAKTKLSRLACG